MIKDFEKKARAYALKNAIAHDGKAMQGSVISSLFIEGMKKEEVGKYAKQVGMIINEVNKLHIEIQKKEFEKLQDIVSEREVREGLQELDNIPKAGVIMRFSPSPSGPLHIGHAATGLPSSLYVKRYGGKFYIRIEDTNPKNIYKKAYEMIPEEADWLFGNVYKVYLQSDRMKKYYSFIEQLIKKGAAYVCDCPPLKFKQLIKQNKACPCRELDVKENISRWKKMLDRKGYKEGAVVLRFKTPEEFNGLNNSNPALRDFPLARIINQEHPKQGKKYRVYPLMNLCVSLDDMEFKITHIIRAKEHRDNAKRQEMIFHVFKKKLPKTYFLGRYKFNDMEISCSKTKAKIDAGNFTGWDDIRLPFIAALRKRGYYPQAFAELAIQRGISEVDKRISREDYFQILDNFNRSFIREKAVYATFQQGKNAKDSLSILMPDASIAHGKSDLNIKNLKDSQIIHFENFGYCRYNKNEKVKFWFAHK